MLFFPRAHAGDRGLLHSLCASLGSGGPRSPRPWGARGCAPPPVLDPGSRTPPRLGRTGAVARGRRADVAGKGRHRLTRSGCDTPRHSLTFTHYFMKPSYIFLVGYGMLCFPRVHAAGRGLPAHGEREGAQRLRSATGGQEQGRVVARRRRCLFLQWLPPPTSANISLHTLSQTFLLTSSTDVHHSLVMRLFISLLFIIELQHSLDFRSPFLNILLL